MQTKRNREGFDERAEECRAFPVEGAEQSSGSLESARPRVDPSAEAIE